ncbi:unnamed protein product, partial [Vitis vinifera]|uniref:Uncharacterized protein n=1 Tax=Vitis vinifera TaxID=29760 RepID=D7UD98_VITVI
MRKDKWSDYILSIPLFIFFLHEIIQVGYIYFMCYSFFYQFFLYSLFYKINFYNKLNFLLKN